MICNKELFEKRRSFLCSIGFLEEHRSCKPYNDNLIFFRRINNDDRFFISMRHYVVADYIGMFFEYSRKRERKRNYYSKDFSEFFELLPKKIKEKFLYNLDLFV